MIQYYSHTEIDCAKWDKLISENGLIYAQSWYLDVVHPNWEALVLDDYEVVMPITGGKKFGVHYLFQPFFVQQLGIFSRRPLSLEQQTEFLKAIPKKFRFAELRLNEKNKFSNDLQGIDYHRNVTLDLHREYGAIRANYHTNTKRNLAKAENNGLQLTDAVTLQQIITLFRANRGATVEVWGNQEYATLLKLGEAALECDAAFLVGVKLLETSELLCGGLFMKTGNRIIFLFSGCSEQGRQKQAMTFMIDGVIKRFENQSFTFDFEGSDDDNLARFYLGFGGQEVKYPSYAFNRLSPWGKALLKAWKKRK